MIEQLLTILQSATETDKKTVPLHAPKFCGNEWRYIKQCLDENMVSSIGSFVTRFEYELCQATEAKYAIATVNGTAALHVSLMVAGVTTEDEVLTSPLSFIATSNAISYCHATPHFVDIEPHSLSIDPNRLHDYLKKTSQYKDGICFNKKTKRPIRACIVTHIFGHPADLDGLMDICQRYDIALVEDAAQGLGSYYKGKHVGHTGIVGAISFNGNKIITTGGGGALLTNDKNIAELAKRLTTTGKVSHPWRYQHDLVAYNYRLPNINAALGVAQLEQLPEFIAEKRRLANYYAQAFSDCDDLTFWREPSYGRSNYWLNTLLLTPQKASQRDKLLMTLTAHQMNCRQAWDLHHQLPMYQDCPRAQLTVAEEIQPRILNLPSSVDCYEQITHAQTQRELLNG